MLLMVTADGNQLPINMTMTVMREGTHVNLLTDGAQFKGKESIAQVHQGMLAWIKQIQQVGPYAYQYGCWSVQSRFRPS